jgi:hypothetical protein
MKEEKFFAMPVADVYPLYVSKAERKGRTKQEVDTVICWLTGYQPDELEVILAEGVTFGAFFQDAPGLNPNRRLITGVICGIRVEEMENGLMQELRYLDKLVDELAKGKAMEKILRG